MKLIKKLKVEQNEKKLSLDDFGEDSGNLFTQENGKLMNYSTPYHTFKDLIVKYNKSILNDESIPDNSKDELLLPNIPLHGLRYFCYPSNLRTSGYTNAISQIRTCSDQHHNEYLRT